MKNKHKFELQKSKAILLCGALLATVTFATAQANADEQTATPTVATKNVVSDATKPKTEDAKKLEPTSDKVEVVEVPKNDNLTGSLDEASKTGTKPEITQTDTEKVENEAQANSDYDKQAEAIKKQTEEKQKEIDAYNAEKARVEAENKVIAEKNKAKKDAFDKAMQEFLKGTNATATVSAKTQNVDNQTFGDSFMTAKTDNEGNFTLTHDMNDGVNIIGQGNLTGKIYYVVVSNGDGSENVTVSRIDLHQYAYSNFTKNSAVNKNINFHVYDMNGNELYSVFHDGESSFTADINKSYDTNKTFTIKPGQTTDVFQVLNIDDNWIYNTHGQVTVQFQNKNATPVKPKYDNENPLPTAPKELAVSWHLNGYEKEKPVTPVVHTVTPTTPVQKAAILPVTGESSNIFATIFGGLMLMFSFLSFKKIKKNI
ncbi:MULTISPECIES: LPXTG cell wall anchor domain-containing protein [Pseudolactococcus]|jgi:LPXTG-motif cell wall-anchored protein|uniref:Gram-positive cocci surface proteins LPxTG domain-containing protein n=1 Tax=Pseudolactococcus piscium MKFS47 TaxID=297352 RepID=A0A0D6E0N3_9LACT|nr:MULTISPECIES: LPXTG cell wall anchor domain-containing protein [Lactococcus]MBQ2637066.1 LPXTG cell wall anchor domain-containing protein [Methanobrevibacter sp.]MBQ4163949.1 LPXTG cell wall anchor domain-containing protein [Turicibacter sp.]MBQ9658427.1 LPXTG cell wall anchor domain-containing protein [Clostridia bacterium]MCJ1971162.1 LPXTG cell wall anchor domain-containing protein [Lactococcus carnosus]CEN29531.1 Uncharacterized protein LACPI_2331 [Lactococcus piscium MKFS47]